MLDQHRSSYSSKRCVWKGIERDNRSLLLFFINSGVACQGPLEYLSGISANPKELFLGEQGPVSPRESVNQPPLLKSVKRKPSTESFHNHTEMAWRHASAKRLLLLVFETEFSF